MHEVVSSPDHGTILARSHHLPRLGLGFFPDPSYEWRAAGPAESPQFNAPGRGTDKQTKSCAVRRQDFRGWNLPLKGQHRGPLPLALCFG